MGRQKSALRRKLNARYMRWAASRSLVAAAPALRRRLNFYGAGAALETVASDLLYRDETVVETPLRSDQIAFIQERCGQNDGVFQPRYWEAPWRMLDEHFLLEDVEMLGHTGKLAHPGAGAIITGWGEPENWNRDRTAILRRLPRLDAVAAPVRAYKSIFHFFFDVALPLTAYFESGRRAPGRHVIVSIANDRPFVTATLEAMAKRYGAEVMRIGQWDKLPCRQAVSFRRKSPCSDWFPVRPETAAALRQALLDHLRPAPLESAAEKVFLRRGQEKLRNLTNADALDTLAAERGYQAFEPGSGNFAEQIQRAAAGRDFLAVHGAALTNLIFAEPGARVVEIFSEDFCKSVYMALCQMMGHEHHAVVSGRGDYRQNFAADIAGTAAALR